MLQSLDVNGSNTFCTDGDEDGDELRSRMK